MANDKKLVNSAVFTATTKERSKTICHCLIARGSSKSCATILYDGHYNKTFWYVYFYRDREHIRPIDYGTALLGAYVLLTAHYSSINVMSL